MHLADAFIQSDLQLHSGYTFSLVHVFPGNQTHNLLRNRRNALPLSHTGTQLLFKAFQLCPCMAGDRPEYNIITNEIISLDICTYFMKTFCILQLQLLKLFYCH